MEQLASIILFLGLILFGLLFLLLSLRGQLRQMKQQLDRLTSLTHKVNLRTQDLEAQTALFARLPKKGSPRAARAKPEAKQREVTEPAISLTRTDSTGSLDVATDPRDSQVITRTSKQHGKSVDTWSSERIWTGADLGALLEAYGKGHTSSEIAVQLGADLKDVVFGIARHAFNCKGELEDLEAAPNHGKKWLARDDETMKHLLERGVGVQEVAFRLGRTQLAIIWRLIS